MIGTRLNKNVIVRIADRFPQYSCFFSRMGRDVAILLDSKIITLTFYNLGHQQ